MKEQRKPIALLITLGQELIAFKGGMTRFIRHFERCLNDDCIWLHKCSNRPKHLDLLHVYIIVSGRIYCRVTFVNYEKGDVLINEPGAANSWSNSRKISWPRIVLAGPIEKPSTLIKMKGFQGFRYVYEDLF